MKKRIISMLLCIVMVLGLVRIQVPTVYASSSENDASTDETVARVYIEGVYDESGTLITYDTLHEAIDAANTRNTGNDVVVVEGTVPFDTAEKPDACTCAYDNGSLTITTSLKIIAKSGSTATVTCDSSNNYKTSILLVDGVKLTIGSDEDDAGTLIFDGGAIWDDGNDSTIDYARWDKAKDSTYNRGIVNETGSSLFKLEWDTTHPEGATLTIGKSATIQNFAGTNSVIATSSYDFKHDTAPDLPEIHIFGKLLNNAAEYGGAVYLKGGLLNIYEGALLSGNSADFGGAICTDGEEDDSSSTLHATINIYGGILENNTAFSGGAIALRCTLDGDYPTDSPELKSPGFTINMRGGMIRNNMAHVWIPSSSSSNLACSMGGGAIVLYARRACFNMTGGSITGNRTLTANGQLKEKGHAISVISLLDGDQQVNLYGGSITDNGVGEDGTVSGTVIHAERQLSVMKILLLYVLDACIDLERVPVESELLELIIELNNKNDLTYEDIDRLLDTSIADWIDLLFELIPYEDRYPNTDTGADFKDDAIPLIQGWVAAGLTEEAKVLTVGDDASIESNQTIGIGVDTYIYFEDIVSPVPSVTISPNVASGSIAIDYGDEIDLDKDRDFTLKNTEIDLINWGTAWYVHEPDQVYAATFKFGSSSYTVADVKGVVLPDVETLNSERGWNIPPDYAEDFVWYYTRYDQVFLCSPGDEVFLTDDTTFIGLFDCDTTVKVTADFNGGVGSSNFSGYEGATSITIDHPYGTYLDVKDLYTVLDPPNSDGTGKVIAVGLTTKKIEGIVDSAPSCEVYNTLSMLYETYTVNPYFVMEETTLYVLWAYDRNENEIPDFLEVTLTVDPNGGNIASGVDLIDGMLRLVASKGTVLNGEILASLRSVLEHADVSDTDVVLVGVTEDTEALGQVYGVDNSLPGSVIVYAGTGEHNSYTLEKDSTLYAVWSYDLNGNGIADIYDVVLTVDANGGTFDMDGPYYDDFTPQQIFRYPFDRGDIIPSRDFANLLSLFSHEDENVILVGVTKDSSVKDKIYGAGDTMTATLVNEDCPLNKDLTLYAVWAYDENGNGIPDYTESIQITYTDGVSETIIFEDQTHYVFVGDSTPEFQLNDETKEPSRAGYTFSGWSPNVANTVSENVTYTAQWTANTYTVRFDANGGSGTMADQSFTYDVSQALPENAFTYAGKYFNGWNTMADGSDTPYTDGQSVSNLTTESNGSVTLYAQWSEKSAQTITLDTSDRSATYGDGTLEEREISASGEIAYSSSDESVATVDENGVITVLKAGETTITATAAETTDYASGSASYKLIVAPKTLTITADSHEAYVGSVQPELTWTVDGLVAGDTLTGEPILTTDADMSKAGTYTITASGASAGENYTICYVDGILTVKSYPDYPVIVPTYYDITVNPAVNGDVSASRETAASGTTITLTVDPDFGYELDALSVTDRYGNEISLTDKANGTYTFRMPAKDVWVDATFKLMDEFIEVEKECPRDWSCPMYSYIDLDMSQWYHDGIHYCIEHGLMVGTGANIFEPNIATSRAMIVTILWRLEGEPAVDYSMTFEDVESGKWYTEAIRWAQANGIVEGYSDKAFGPNDIITREQMVTIMWRYAKYKGYDVSVGENTNILSYDDAFDVAEWAIPAMQWACGSGMIQGIADGNQMNLAPQGNATRAQAAAILQRYCENVAKVN